MTDAMKSTGIWARIPLRRSDGTFLSFEPDEIYYLQAEDDDTFIRTARRTRYRSTRRLRDLARTLPSAPFFPCHESYIVNLARV